MGLVLRWPVDPMIAMASALLSTGVGLGLVSFAEYRAKPEPVAQSTSRFASSEWRLTVVPMLLLALLEILMNRTGVIVSGWVIGTTEAGIYALVFSISVLVTFPQVAVSALFAPAVAALHSRGDRATLQSIVTTTNWWSFLGGLGIALPIFLIAHPLLALFGATFTDGATALRILLVGQLVIVGAGPNRFLMTMTGH
jgi:O-antigen/teichoic acid export membrane protein